MLRTDAPDRRVKSSTGFAANMTYPVELADAQLAILSAFIWKTAPRSLKLPAVCATEGRKPRLRLKGIPTAFLVEGPPHRTSNR